MAHICWVIRDLRGGGAERVVISAVNGLCARGHRVDLVLFFPVNEYPGDISEQASVFVLSRRPGRWSRTRKQAANLLRKKQKSTPGTGIPENAHWTARRLPSARLPDLAFRLLKRHRWPVRDLVRRQRRADFVRALRLGRYFEEQKPDIVFTNLWQADIAGFLASMLTRNCLPVIPIAHCSVDRGRTGHLDFLHRVFSTVGQVVAVSRGVAANFVETVNVAPDRITTIYNPVVTPKLTRLAEEEPDHPWFRDDGPPMVLGVGRLTAQKDFPTLIEAFRLVRAERLCRLLILGEGSMRHELERSVRELGLEESVRLPGWAENPYAFMAQATLFVLSSSHEGLPTVLIEALACGCPAVSTDCPSGPAEILGDPALLAPVGDPEALAQIMLRALDHPSDRAALRAKAATRFSVERTVDRYEQVVADILARRKQSSPGQKHRTLG